MAIRHKFNSPISNDGIPSGEVKPSDWNDDHDIDGFLGALVSLALASNSIAYVDGSGTAQLTLLTAVGRAILAGATPADVLAYLGGSTLDNAHLTGAPTAPTPPAGDGSTRIATMEAVQTAIANLVASSPSTLDTLNEIANALGNDANFSATMTAALGFRVRFDAAQSLTSPQLTQVYTNLGLGNVVTYNVGTGANNVVKLDGSSKLPAVDGSALTAVTVTWGNVSGKPAIGTGPNNLVQLDASSKLPAVDGSQLTGVTAAGAVLYNGAQALTSDQKAVAQVNAGGRRFTGKIVASVAANAMTLAIKTPSGADPSAGVPIGVNVQDSAGAASDVAITAASSIVIPSGTTLGHTAAASCPIYLYAIQNAGAIELAVSAKYFGRYGTVSTSAIAGGGTPTTMYSTTARASVPFTLIGVAYSTQTTAGTWAAAPTSIEIGELNLRTYAFQADMNSANGTTNGLASATATKCGGLSRANVNNDSAFDTTNARFVCREPGFYSFSWQWATVEAVNGYIHGLIYKNAAQIVGGPTANAGGGFSPVVGVTADLLLVPGDVIEFYCRQTDASAKTIYGNTTNTFASGKIIRAPH